MTFLFALFFSLSAHAYDIDTLESQITARQPHTVGEVIELLPEEMKRNFVLMARSRSIQEGEPDNPRALLYTDSAQTFVAFNGRPGQRGYDTVETIQFKPESGTYEFRRFFLPEGGTVQTVTVERDPAICYKCHGINAQPLWEPEPKWPLTFGTGRSLAVDEQAALRKFAAETAIHPRYGKLDRETNLARSLASGVSPAYDMSLRLRAFRASYLARQIRSTVDYEKFKFAILAAITMCPDLPSYVPLSEPWADPNNLAKSIAQMQFNFQRLEPETKLLLADRRGDSMRAWIGRLLWLIEGRGIRLERWGTSLQSRYFFDATEAGIRDLIWYLTFNDPDLVMPADFINLELLNEFQTNSNYRPEFSGAYLAYCQDLKSKSQRRVAGH